MKHFTDVFLAAYIAALASIGGVLYSLHLSSRRLNRNVTVWVNASGVKRHRAYARYVLRHKLLVFQEGRKLGVPLHRLIIHDWDKFLPDMWLAYAKTFYAADGTKQYQPGTNFERTWLRHIHLNPHHWQHWVLIRDNGHTVKQPIPSAYLREMLADWRAASRAQGNVVDLQSWYSTRRSYILLHADAREWLDTMIGYDREW